MNIYFGLKSRNSDLLGAIGLLTYPTNIYKPSFLQIGYLFIPCDGSVVSNHEDQDMGCMDHKNRQGQFEVATFLLPFIEKEIKILLDSYAFENSYCSKSLKNPKLWGNAEVCCPGVGALLKLLENLIRH